MELTEIKKKARALTRREVRDLKEKGLSIGGMTPENSDEVADAVVELVYGDAKQFDELPYPDYRQLFKEVVDKTYGGTAEKN